jgi:hypothetical protein
MIDVVDIEGVLVTAVLVFGVLVVANLVPLAH